MRGVRGTHPGGQAAHRGLEHVGREHGDDPAALLLDRRGRVLKFDSALREPCMDGDGHSVGLPEAGPVQRPRPGRGGAGRGEGHPSGQLGHGELAEHHRRLLQ